MVFSKMLHLHQLVIFSTQHLRQGHRGGPHKVTQWSLKI